MCVVIKKLTHPYSLTHKNYNKNGWSIFFVWVSYGERGERLFLVVEFLKVFFQNFLTIF